VMHAFPKPISRTVVINILFHTNGREHKSLGNHGPRGPSYSYHEATTSCDTQVSNQPRTRTGRSESVSGVTEGRGERRSGWVEFQTDRGFRVSPP
jgi:hypothetical protein